MSKLSLVTWQVFPPHWGWRRVFEVGVAGYQASVGAVAFVHPETFDHTSYCALLDIMSPQYWGFALWVVALSHATAIWANSARPALTATLRTIASGLHLLTLILLGICFIEVGDYYRLTTTAWLTFAVLAAISVATQDVAAEIKHVERSE